MEKYEAYNLFKTYSLEKDYSQAEYYLKEYENKLSDSFIDFSLYHALLDILNDKEPDILYNCYFINNVKLKYPEAVELYSSIIQNINNKEFRKALYYLHKLQNFLIEKNINLDFTIYINLLSEIINTELDKLLNKAYKYISKGEFDNAVSLLNTIRSHSKFKHVKTQYKLLKKYLNEQMQKTNIMNSKLKEQYEYIKMWAEIYKCYGDDYLALQYYLYGIYATNYPEFYYRAGVCYFKLGNQKQAYNYFLEYIKKGGFEYSIEVYEYLSQCKISLNYKSRQYYKFEKKKISNFIKEITGKEKIFELDFVIDIEKVYYSKGINYILQKYSLGSNLQIIEDINYLYEKNYIELAETLYYEFLNNIANDGSLYKKRIELEQNRITYINKAKELSYSNQIK